MIKSGDSVLNWFNYQIKIVHLGFEDYFSLIWEIAILHNYDSLLVSGSIDDRIEAVSPGQVTD